MDSLVDPQAKDHSRYHSKPGCGFPFSLQTGVEREPNWSLETAVNKPQALRPIPTELAKFLDFFPGPQIFCSIPPEDVNTSPLHYPGSIDKAYPQLLERQTYKWQTFFTVNVSSTIHRRALDMVEARACFIDDDTPHLGGPRRDFIIPPSIIVETSKDKYHYYWLTRTTDLATWSLVQEALIVLYKTDPAIKDSPRVLRLPTFVHTSGFTSRVVSSPGHLYKWETFIQHYPPLPPSQQSLPEANTAAFSLLKTQKLFLSGESIAPAMNSLIMHWSYHYSAIKIKDMLVELFDEIDQEIYSANSKRYESARSQIDKFVKSGKIKVGADTPKLHNISEVKVPLALEWDWSILKSNPLPLDSIPDVLIDAAEEVGDWTATGRDPAILSAIFLTSSLLSKNILIHEIGDDLTTHSQCGIVIVMDTGARKSSIYEQMNKPFFKFEERLVKEWEEQKHENSNLVGILEEHLKKHKKSAPKIGASLPELLAHAQVGGSIEKQIADIQVKRPWLRSSDVTEEKLVRKLDENEGTIAIISDDARQVMANLKGRYSKDVSGESVYINALTGSDILYERVGSDKEIHIKDPVLNALLFVQPDAALSLKNSEMYVPSGLAARLPMYFYPVYGADIVSNTKRRILDETKMQKYYSALDRLCLRRFDNPLHIRLSENGVNACRAMDKKFADLLNGPWIGHYDKTNKLITLTCMYASCFAALEDPNFSIAYHSTNTDTSYVIPTYFLNMGFKFAVALFKQSINSFKTIENESKARDARMFLEQLKGFHKLGLITEGFSNTSEIKNWVNTSRRDGINECVDFLLEKDWLYVTVWTDEPKKLNGGGRTNKIVSPGDFVYHLNVKGIAKRKAMKLDDIEGTLDSK
jgi:hypothetical protein